MLVRPATSLNVHTASTSLPESKTSTVKPGKGGPVAPAQQRSRAFERESSTESSSSEDLISYNGSESDEPMGNIVHGVQTTKQKKDRRPLSDWHLKPWSKMSWGERLCYRAAAPQKVHELVPETFDRGPMPTMSMLRDNGFVLSRAFAPLVLQQLLQNYFQTEWKTRYAYYFYVFNFIVFAHMVLHRLNKYSLKWGHLDEKNVGRDRTPNASVNKLAIGVLSYMLLRPLFAILLTYDQSAQPLTNFTWTYPLKLMGWQLTLDYVFYCYHRLTHEVDTLWWVHKHHHSTKHPTAILSILAEDYQEVLEIFVLPFVTTLLWPMTFSETWVTLCYTLNVEMMGHSGIRAMWRHPTLGWLKMFDMDGAIEDHDLHHRMGKSGINFGKQSGVWDKLFGTRGERQELYGM